MGIDAIVLDSGQDGMAGWCSYWAGVVAICVWERELWSRCDPEFVEEHRHVLDVLVLDVECVSSGKLLELRWTEAQARAYQLLHILPHELGHHRDRMSTRSRRIASRGEPYAEGYAKPSARRALAGVRQSIRLKIFAVSERPGH